MIQTKAEKVAVAIIYVILTVFAFICLYPFWYVFISSISEGYYVQTGQITILPKGINFSAYKQVFTQDGIWTAYANTVFYTLVGTAVNMIFTILGAYPLSKKRLIGRTFLSFFISFTLWFSAGIIPTYLNFKDLNLIDNRASIIIGFAVQTFYVILLRTYFQSIPETIEESAKIDGANDIRILIQIYIPLSVASLLTIGLYYAVERWNGYFWAMILFKSEHKVPIQVLLMKLIVEMSGNQEAVSTVDIVRYSLETVVYATIIVAIVPILLVFPLVQKYFVKGIMVGSIKG